LFHYDMQDVRSRGIEATSTVSASRAVLGREQVNLLLRLAERWERYPPGIHDDMIDLDMNAVFRDVSYLESLILRRMDSLVWERARSPDHRFRQQFIDNELLNSQFDPTRIDKVQMMIGSHPDHEQSAVLYVHVPEAFDRDKYEVGQWGMFAVLNIPRMMANQVSLRSPIYTYIAVTDDLLMDQSGHWVTQETLNYLTNHALFLHQSQMVTDHMIPRPVYASIYDLSDLRSRALLHMLISVAGAGIVPCMSLTGGGSCALVVLWRH